MEPVPEDQHFMKEYGSRYQKLVQEYFKQINVVSGMCSCCKHMFNLLLMEGHKDMFPDLMLIAI